MESIDKSDTGFLKSPPQRLRREPPQRLTPSQLLYKAAKAVPQFEVNNLISYFMELYHKYFGRTFVSLGRPADQTALRRIITLCSLKGWPLRDFVAHNVDWYKHHTPYRPLPVNLCGPKAEARYEAFLRTEGYITAEAPVPRLRVEEVASMEATKNRVESLRSRHLLQEQAEEDAIAYANAEAAKVTTPAKPLPELDWIPYTEEQLMEMARQRVWADAKIRYMRMWRERAIYGIGSTPAR